jgi:hypothetical protein
MKTNRIMLAAAVSLLLPLTLSQAQDATAKREGRRGQHALLTPEQRAEKIIKRWDKDGDGKLDATELTAALAARRERREERWGKRHEQTATTPAPTPAATPTP